MFKTMVFGLAAAGIGGIAMTAGYGGHDAQQMVAKPPAEVYAAISAMAEEGVRESDPTSDLPMMTLTVTKEQGSAVHYVLTLEGKQLASLDLEVAPAKGGAASQLSADLELDQRALARLGTPEGDGFIPLPDPIVNIGVAKMLGEMAAEIEAGNPLPAFGPAQLAGWDHKLPSPAERQAMSEEMQAAAAAPTPPQVTGSTAPMVDPNEEARKYLKGGQ